MDSNLFDEFFGITTNNNLGRDQQLAFDTVTHNDDNFFITGAAGTGKSVLLRHIVDNSTENTVVVAPTGIAALNVSGQTIHSFFKLPFGVITNKNEIRHHGGNEYNLIKPLKRLIIDEISMVRSDIMQGIDWTLRKNKGIDAPFGGVQVIMIGDLHQLPPVVTADDVMELRKMYKSPYFFDSRTIREDPIQIINLAQIFRQNDELFISLLNKIKVGRISSNDLSIINDRCYRSEYTHQHDIINLCTLNKKADYINERMLTQIDKPEQVYIGELGGEFKESNIPVPMKIVLKEGCRIMFRNNDLDKRWSNGTLGTVTEIKSNGIVVVLLDDGNTMHVDKHTWEMKKYKLDKNTGMMGSIIVGTYTQIPMCVAYGISIHKSQGCTFEKAHLDFGDNVAFATGQTYTAISRVKSLDGLTLARPILLADIKVDKLVTEYLNE